MPDPAHPRPNVFHEQFVVPPLLERRLWAAATDMAVVLGCCFALAHSFSPLSKAPHPWVWRPAAVLLAAYAAIELLTGVTLGKLFTGLTVRRRDGRRAPLWMLASRAALKYLPVVVFLPSLFLDGNAFVAVVATAFTLAVGELQACYLAMMRTGVTVFDHAVGTMVVVRPNPSPLSPTTAAPHPETPPLRLTWPG